MIIFELDFSKTIELLATLFYNFIFVSQLKVTMVLYWKRYTGPNYLSGRSYTGS